MTADAKSIAPAATESADLPTMAAPYVPPAPEGPQSRMRPLGFSDPFRWLARGWQDLTRHPGIALFYGLCFWFMAQVLALVFKHKPEYTLSLVSGCLLVGPFLASLPAQQAMVVRYTLDRTADSLAVFLRAIRTSVGSTPITALLGNNGDFYINTAANTIYGPKTAGAWGSPTSLVGPTGATGATGATGEKGEKGDGGCQKASINSGLDGREVFGFCF